METLSKKHKNNFTLPIGRSDFKNIIQNSFYYVDKTLFIEEAYQQTSQVILILRPRRFGKTLNLSMLRYFFEKSDEHTAKLFDNLKIKEKEIFSKHQGKYPIIFLTFKDTKATTILSCIDKIRTVLAEEYQRHSYLINSNNLTSNEKEQFLQIVDNKLNLTEEQNILEDSLYNLCKALTKHHGKKVILLMDEYDTPVHEGYFYNYHKEILAFLRNFLSKVLKDNEQYLERAFLTGILKIAKESIFSGLNNVKAYTLLDEEFADKFGLTGDEVKQLLHDYSCSDYYKKVKEWYNGYHLGDKTELYNPWSILNFVDAKNMKFRPWWLNTSENKLVRDLILNNYIPLQEDLEELLSGRKITCQVKEDMVFQQLQKNRETIWSFFLFSGYLNVTSSSMINDVWIHMLNIPNRELRLFFRETIATWFQQKVGEDVLVKMLNSLASGDIKLFEFYLQKMVLEIFSYHDINSNYPERVFHAFMLGLLVHYGERYQIRSNRESGEGRYDIMLTPKDKNKLGIVLEFKSIQIETAHEKPIKEALEQIKTKKYVTELHANGVSKNIGIAILLQQKQIFVAKTEL